MGNTIRDQDAHDRQVDALRAHIRELQHAQQSTEHTQKIRERERQELLAIANMVDHPIFVSDPNTYEVLYANEAFKKQWGQGVGKTCHEIIHSLNVPHEQCPSAYVSDESSPPGILEFQAPKDLRWYRCIHKAIPWPDGRTLRYQMAIAIADHQQTRRREASILQTAADGFYTVDTQGKILEVNQACCHLTGYTEQELLSMTLHDLDVMETAQNATSRIQRVLQTEPLRFETSYRRKDGTQLPVEVVINCPQDEKGYVFAFFRDVSVSKQTEEAARKRCHKLEKKMAKRDKELRHWRDTAVHSEPFASIGMLTAGIAHEMNNPIGAILLAAQDALASSKDKKNVTQALTEIVNQAIRAKNIARHTLKCARQEISDKCPADLNDIVRHAKILTSQYTARVRCHTALVLDKDLPPVNMSQLEMEQVVVNLIRNATEASASNIVITTDHSHDRVYLTVKDDGHGITKKEIKHLFGVFYTTRKNRGGTGLGLNITHRIVRDHGGTIEVASEPGKETLFTICLPPLLRPSGETNGQSADH